MSPSAFQPVVRMHSPRCCQNYQADLGVPVLIVQHMPPVFTKSLAASLDKKCALTVKEAEEGEAIQPNVVYIAPGGKQMKLSASADGKNRCIKLTNDPPENSCRPSVGLSFSLSWRLLCGKDHGGHNDRNGLRRHQRPWPS